MKYVIALTRKSNDIMTTKNRILVTGGLFTAYCLFLVYIFLTKLAY